MQSIHLVVGASAAALLGAVTGATMNTSPLERGVDAWEQIPRHDFASAQSEADSRRQPLPDHYPLVTPQGRFEVGELRNRGLYRNRRFGMASWWVDDFEPAYEVAAADYRYVPDNIPEPAPSARTPRPASPPAGKPPVLAADTPPLDVGEPPPVEVQPRTIDVGAVLAARN